MLTQAMQPAERERNIPFPPFLFKITSRDLVSLSLYFGRVFKITVFIFLYRGRLLLVDVKSPRSGE